jgi:hypothetical protein
MSGTNLAYDSSVGNLTILDTLTANNLTVETLTSNNLTVETLTANNLTTETLTANTINTQIFNLGTGTTQSFTCFSSQWDNYDVTVNITNNSSTSVSMNCTYNGVNASVWNYNVSNLTTSTTTTRVNGTPVPLCNTVGISGYPHDVVTFTVYNPYLQQKTYVKAINDTYNPDGNMIVNGYCINPPNNSFNQLTLTFSQTIVGGTVSVRGFN